MNSICKIFQQYIFDYQDILFKSSVDFAFWLLAETINHMYCRVCFKKNRLASSDQNWKKNHWEFDKYSAIIPEVLLGIFAVKFKTNPSGGKVRANIWLTPKIIPNSDSHVHFKIVTRIYLFSFIYVIFLSLTKKTPDNQLLKQISNMIKIKYKYLLYRYLANGGTENCTQAL